MESMRARRRHAVARPLPTRHGRHGRQGRSAVVRPPLPPLETRYEKFDVTVGTAVDFLTSSWEELRDVSFEIGDMPDTPGGAGIPRWHIDREHRRIVLFRLPIERLGRPYRDDDLHQRMAVEGSVFRAAAEYLGRDPWDLGPERFRYF